MTVEGRHRLFAGYGINDDSHDDELQVYLNQASDKVMLKAYPYGFTYTQRTATESKYATTIDELFTASWSKRGAEGQSSHSENGISRGYQSDSEIMKDIVPNVGTLSS